MLVWLSTHWRFWPTYFATAKFLTMAVSPTWLTLVVFRCPLISCDGGGCGNGEAVDHQNGPFAQAEKCHLRDAVERIIQLEIPTALVVAISLPRTP